MILTTINVTQGHFTYTHTKQKQQNNKKKRDTLSLVEGGLAGKWKLKLVTYKLACCAGFMNTLSSLAAVSRTEITSCCRTLWTDTAEYVLYITRCILCVCGCVNKRLLNNGAPEEKMICPYYIHFS